MANDALSSWHYGPTKSTIVDFVTRVTGASGSDFVSPPARIAAFDNDGTLWCEQSLQVQFFFARAWLETLAQQEPTLKDRQPYKAFLEHDMKFLIALGKKGFFSEVGAATYAGMTEAAFDMLARNWLATTKHPKLRRLFTDRVYQPQLEVLAYLRANGFKTFVVSGGGIDLIRSFAEATYGIPTEHVVGSSVRTRFELQNERGEIMKLAEIGSFDDRKMKRQNIQLHVGRRPILAFGNSDGDLAMLRYTYAGGAASGAAYPPRRRRSRIQLRTRLQVEPTCRCARQRPSYGTTVVSMKRDWKRVFKGAA